MLDIENRNLSFENLSSSEGSNGLLILDPNDITIGTTTTNDASLPSVTGHTDGNHLPPSFASVKVWEVNDHTILYIQEA